MKQPEKYFWIMDGRARYSIDDALVLYTADTFEEALEDIGGYGTDTCIVLIDGEKQELVYGPGYDLEVAKSLYGSINKS